MPTSSADPAATESRRERNKRLTHAAILEAASELFRAHGYDAVTTQQIAERADVSNGTFFRYARTKADLLVMLMTDRVRAGREAGLELARAGAPAEEAVLALLAPLADISMERPELGLAYQRELLFPTREDRVEALDAVEHLQATIAEILLAGVGAGHERADVEVAALAVYSTAYIELVRFAVGRVGREEIREQLRSTIATLVERLLPTR